MSLEGQLWEAAEEKIYGEGAGAAHPSVEWVKCPCCGAEPGHLCLDDHGDPKLTRHVARVTEFRALRRLWWNCGLEERHQSPGRRTRQQLLRELRQIPKRRKPRSLGAL